MKTALALLLALCTFSCSRGSTSEAVGTSSTNASSTDALDVTLNRDGVVLIGARKLLLDDEVGAAFAAFREHVPRGRLVIHAHRATLHGRLVRIIDLAKDANVPFDIVIED